MAWQIGTLLFAASIGMLCLEVGEKMSNLRNPWGDLIRTSGGRPAGDAEKRCRRRPQDRTALRRSGFTTANQSVSGRARKRARQRLK